MSEGRGQQSKPASGERRRYRVAGSGEWAAACTRPDDPAAGDHIDDLAAGYALDALDAPEREQVETHIQVCPSCTRLIAADSRVAGFLPYLSVPATPSFDVKVALFTRIAHADRAPAPSILSTPPTFPPSTTATMTIPPSRPSPAFTAPASMAVPVLADKSARVARARSGWMLTALSVPLLLGLIAVGAWGVEMRGNAVAANSQLGDLQAQYASFAAGHTVALQPGGAEPSAQGSITVSATDQRRVLLSMKLDNPRPDRVYELLVNDGEKIVPKGSIQVHPDGRVQEVVDLDLPYDEYESIEVKAKPVPGDEAGGATESILRNDGNGSIGDTNPSANDLIP